MITCTIPEGQRISTRSTAEIAPSPNSTGSEFCDNQPEPPDTSRICESPPATTRTRAPMPAAFEMVPMSRLTRTNYVGPDFPRAARRRNISGSVDVTFTVTTDGKVRALTVLKSEPGDTFDQAALEAVEQWRFEPVIENGAAVEKRTAVRLAFALQ